MLSRYGPFWICSTLIFVAAAIGTFVTYIAHKLQKKEWNYDINLVTWSAGLFYGYVTIVPLCLYIILKYFSAPSGLVQLFCLYGYSLFVFIPALVCYRLSVILFLFWSLLTDLKSMDVKINGHIIWIIWCIFRLNISLWYIIIFG